MKLAVASAVRTHDSGRSSGHRFDSQAPVCSPGELLTMSVSVQSIIVTDTTRQKVIACVDCDHLLRAEIGLQFLHLQAGMRK